MQLISTLKKKVSLRLGKILLSQRQMEFFRKITGESGLVKHLGTKGVYLIKLPNGRHARFISSNTLADNRIIILGLFYNEKVSKLLWMDLCTKTNAVADIGANVGQFSVLALACNSQLFVDAFEPFPVNIDILKANLAQNENAQKRATIFQVALGNKTGIETLHYCEGNIYTPSLKKGGNADASINVTVDLMDNLVTRKTDLIKMDVEGAEPIVLDGMHRILKEDSPIILIEILQPSTGQAIQEIMETYHYKFYHINESRGLVATESLSENSTYFRNFLLVPPSKLSWLPQHLLA